jgi:hypothetical protein
MDRRAPAQSVWNPPGDCLTQRPKGREVHTITIPPRMALGGSTTTPVHLRSTST